jgi:hypothetical protein
MAHAQLLKIERVGLGKDTLYVPTPYVTHTYDADLAEELDRRTKIMRFTYDEAA